MATMFAFGRNYVCFSVDTVITRQVVIVGFDQAGIDIDHIMSIQQRASNNSRVVTFGGKAMKDAVLNEQSIKIASCSVLLGDCENKVIIVKIYELANEPPDSVVIGRLSITVELSLFGMTTWWTPC